MPSPGGQFTALARPPARLIVCRGTSGALVELGVDDPRLDKAFDWMARSVTGEGIGPPETDRPRALLRGQMRACFRLWLEQQAVLCLGSCQGDAGLGSLAPRATLAVVQRAIQPGVEFLLSVDPPRPPIPAGMQSSRAKTGGSLASGFAK